MALEVITEKRTRCPSCGKAAKRVSTVTLRALLKEPFADAAAGANHSCCQSNGNSKSGCTALSTDTGWRFCDSPGCDVVYFAENGGTTFTKSQLRAPVGVKETVGERPLCYCFGHSIAGIKSEIRMKGRSDALEDIRAKMNDPGCRCESENPSGACCLGSVARGITIAQEELGMSNGSSQVKSVRSMTSLGELIANVGSLISAVVASACCWLPLVLLALGVSGAGIASTLEAYRPLFIIVTAVFLGAAFYFTYRPRKVTDSAHAGGEACCPPPTRNRFTAMTFNKVMLWVVTAVAVAFLLFPSYVGVFIGGGDRRLSNSTNRTTIRIEGMTCEACSAVVASAIRAVPTVRDVTVDYKTSQAVVATAARDPIPKDQILAALRKAGYKGTIVPGCCELPSPTEEDNGSGSTQLSASLQESHDETTVAELSDKK